MIRHFTCESCGKRERINYDWLARMVGPILAPTRLLVGGSTCTCGGKLKAD